MINIPAIIKILCFMEVGLVIGVITTQPKKQPLPQGY